MKIFRTLLGIVVIFCIVELEAARNRPRPLPIKYRECKLEDNKVSGPGDCDLTKCLGGAEKLTCINRDYNKSDKQKGFCSCISKLKLCKKPMKNDKCWKWGQQMSGGTDPKPFIVTVCDSICYWATEEWPQHSEG